LLQNICGSLGVVQSFKDFGHEAALAACWHAATSGQEEPATTSRAREACHKSSPARFVTAIVNTAARNAKATIVYIFFRGKASVATATGLIQRTVIVMLVDVITLATATTASRSILLGECISNDDITAVPCRRVAIATVINGIATTLRL